MKLYVWEDVLYDYSGGIMFALANSEQEAREVILKKDDLSAVRDDLRKKPQVFDAPVGFVQWGGA